MAYLTDANTSDSDSDDLPAVNIVLQGNDIAQAGKSKVNKRVEEDVHTGTLEDKRARRLRRVILDDSDEQGDDEPETENEKRDIEVSLFATEELTINWDERYMQRREKIKKGSITSEIAYIDQIWKSTYALRFSDSNEGTQLEGEDDLEARFANKRLVCDRNSSNNDREGGRHSLSTKVLRLEPGSGHRGRPATPERRTPVQGHQDPKERSEVESKYKSRLISPTKRKQRQQNQHHQQCPRSPSASEYRENGDNFWRQSLVNEWNDFYSPDKRTLSPKKLALGDQHSAFKLPDSDNRAHEKISLNIETDKESAGQKKLFRATKHATAETFLAEVDQEVTGGLIADLTRTTGGVKLIWSKKLLSTAGRAHWKRIKPKIENNCGDVTTSEQHYASIELAEKVIDNDNRLKNVIAHEFCHLANFMISGVKDNPHGKSFKEWARKCSKKFARYGVEVTTRHNYDVEYKYIWQCISCSMLFKRHSKSIDPKKQACGSCTSKLIQIKPSPRNGNQTDYQLFIKSHFQNVKSENPKASHASIMQILSSRYRREREINVSATPVLVNLETLNDKLRSLAV